MGDIQYAWGINSYVTFADLTSGLVVFINLTPASGIARASAPVLLIMQDK